MLKHGHIRIGETILGIFALGLAAFIGLQTWMTPPSVAQAVVGPGMFPAIIATGLTVVGLQLFYEAFLYRFAREDFPQLDWKAMIVVAIAFAAQIVLLERLGWIFSGTLLFVVCAMAFGSRAHVRNIAFGLALTSITYLVFDYGLDLDLPTGTYAEDLLAVSGGTN